LPIKKEYKFAGMAIADPFTCQTRAKLKTTKHNKETDAHEKNWNNYGYSNESQARPEKHSGQREGSTDSASLMQTRCEETEQLSEGW
jgi:hypothetical protein